MVKLSKDIKQIIFSYAENPKNKLNNEIKTLHNKQVENLEKHNIIFKDFAIIHNLINLEFNKLDLLEDLNNKYKNELIEIYNINTIDTLEDIKESIIDKLIPLQNKLNKLNFI